MQIVLSGNLPHWVVVLQTIWNPPAAVTLGSLAKPSHGDRQSVVDSLMPG